jgi:hypothetical protein
MYDTANCLYTSLNLPQCNSSRPSSSGSHLVRKFTRYNTSSWAPKSEKDRDFKNRTSRVSMATDALFTPSDSQAITNCHYGNQAYFRIILRFSDSQFLAFKWKPTTKLCSSARQFNYSHECYRDWVKVGMKIEPYGLDDRGSRIRFPAGTGNFSLHHRVQNGSGAHPMGTRGSFPEGKAAGSWSWQLICI